jgi:hypothetical protein
MDNRITGETGGAVHGRKVLGGGATCWRII